jgi:hypothetical protein
MDALTTIRDYLDQANNALEQAVCEAEDESAISARQFERLETAQAMVFDLLKRIDAKLRHAQAETQQSEVQP